MTAHRHTFGGQTLSHDHPHERPHGYYGHPEDRPPFAPGADTGTYERVAWWADELLRPGEYDVPVFFRVTGPSAEAARESVGRILADFYDHGELRNHTVPPMWLPASLPVVGPDDVAQWLIGGEHDDLGPLFWSNGSGWVPLADAEWFTASERLVLGLPVGGGWLHLSELDGGAGS